MFSITTFVYYSSPHRRYLYGSPKLKQIVQSYRNLAPLQQLSPLVLTRVQLSKHPIHSDQTTNQRPRGCLFTARSRQFKQMLSKFPVKFAHKFAARFYVTNCSWKALKSFILNKVNLAFVQFVLAARVPTLHLRHILNVWPNIFILVWLRTYIYLMWSSERKGLIIN